MIKVSGSGFMTDKGFQNKGFQNLAARCYAEGAVVKVMTRTLITCVSSGDFLVDGGHGKNVHTCMYIFTYFCVLGPFGTPHPLLYKSTHGTFVFWAKFMHPPPQFVQEYP